MLELPPAEVLAMFNDLPARGTFAAPPSELTRGLKAALPLLIGLLPFGMLLGAEAAQKGLTSLQVPLLTGLNFGGASEFAALAIWTDTPNLLLILSVTLLVNSRHILMGLTFAPYLKGLPAHKALAALFFLVDESWALTLDDTKKRGTFSLPFFLGSGIAIWITWAGSTTFGALIGPALGDITRFGFDMAFPAVFLVLLSGMWKGTRTAYPWLVSLICASTASLLLPGAWYVPIGALSGVLCALIMARTLK